MGLIKDIQSMGDCDSKVCGNNISHTLYIWVSESTLGDYGYGSHS